MRTTETRYLAFQMFDFAKDFVDLLPGIEVQPNGALTTRAMLVHMAKLGWPQSEPAKS